MKSCRGRKFGLQQNPKKRAEQNKLNLIKVCQYAFTKTHEEIGITSSLAVSSPCSEEFAGTGTAV